MTVPAAFVFPEASTVKTVCAHGGLLQPLPGPRPSRTSPEFEPKFVNLAADELVVSEV